MPSQEVTEAIEVGYQALIGGILACIKEEEVLL